MEIDFADPKQAIETCLASDIVFQNHQWTFANHKILIDGKILYRM